MGHLYHCLIFLPFSNLRELMISETVTRLGRLDILVHSAGIARPDSGPDTCSEATYDLVMDTNLKAVFFLTQAALPHLERSRGCVLTVSSVYSVTPGHNQAVYAVSKAALDHLTRCVVVLLVYLFFLFS